jgi:hypothetical protein
MHAVPCVPRQAFLQQTNQQLPRTSFDDVVVDLCWQQAGALRVAVVVGRWRWRRGRVVLVAAAVAAAVSRHVLAVQG